MLALPANCIGLAMTNASDKAVPTFGRQAVLGTNPIAVAAPAGRERPFVLDMSTTTVSLGKLEIADRLDGPLPAGWAVDRSGRPAQDPHQGEPLAANLGHFFGAWCIDAIRPVDEFQAAMDELQQLLKNGPRAAGQERIYIHGEKEYEALERSLKEGVALSPLVAADLDALALELGL